MNCNSIQKLSIPSKVFLLGEYYVLESGKSLVATIQPYFKLFTSSHATRWMEGSPADKLEKYALQQGLYKPGATFYDPTSGGLGASTAQFILLYQYCGFKLDPWEAWKLYRSFFTETTILPSGCDLLAQWVGGLQMISSFEKTMRNFCNHSFFNHLIVFSQAHICKVKTHEHLKTLKKIPLKELDFLWHRGVKALEENTLEEYAHVMNEYGNVLGAAGLEHARTQELKKAFRSFPTVLAVKGSGALQADLLLVLVQDFSELNSLLMFAQKMQLQHLQTGLHNQQEAI